MNLFLFLKQWRMQVIAPYSLTHLLIAVGAILLPMILAIILHKKSISASKVLWLTGVILLLSEIYKQCFLTAIRNGDYSWSDFPFQLCSIPMYLGLLYPFMPCSKQRILENFIMTFGLLGGIAAFIEPTSSFSSYVFLTVHSITWHSWIIFLSVFLFLKNKKQPFSCFFKAAVLYLLLSCIAVILNSCLASVSHGTCNMFFLGPSQPCIYVLDTIWGKAGWQLETLLMIAVSILGACVIFLLLNLAAWIIAVKKSHHPIYYNPSAPSM